VSQAAASTTKPQPHGGPPLFAGETGENAQPIPPLDPPAAWDREVDVVVVGTGYGGLTATLYAAQQNASVIAIEKDDVTGGSSRHACGTMIICGGSKAQNEIGYGWPVFPYDVDASAAKILQYYNYSVDSALLRAALTEGPLWFDWILEQGGINWLCGGGMFIDAANLNINKDPNSPYAGTAQFLGNGQTCDALENDARVAGAEFMLNTRCDALVADAGRVIGVKVTDKSTDTEIFVKADKGVILTAGGFGVNLDMLAKYIPSAYMYAVSGGPMPSHTGEAIRMGVGMGADISGFDSFSCWEGGLDDYWGDGDGQFFHYFWYGPSQVAQNPWLLIDKAGNRVPFYLDDITSSTNLLQPGFDPTVYTMGDLSTAASWMSTVGHRAYCIFDADYEAHLEVFKRSTYKGGDFSRTPLTVGYNIAEGIDPTPFASLDWQSEFYKAIESGSVKKADTLEDLAAQLKIEPDRLAIAVERWNDICEQGKDTDLPIPYLPEWLIPIKNSPYYGIAEGGHISKTLAGLRVNTKMQVIDRDANVIPGLYAGWTTAGGLAGESSYGGQLGNCTPFGSVGASGVGGFMAIRGLLASE
jgi:succinate dehydrogenase/fumarate reductase flavoprotein subunit